MKNVADYLATLADVSYPGLTFHVAADGGDRYYLQVHGTEIDHTTDLSVGVRGRKWMLSPFMTRSEIIQTALKAVLAYNEHEAREAFKYRGRAVFGPHIDVDVLHEHCEVLDTRADPVDPAKYAVPERELQRQADIQAMRTASPGEAEKNPQGDIVLKPVRPKVKIAPASIFDENNWHDVASALSTGTTGPWSWGYVTCKIHGAVWQDRNLSTTCRICEFNDEQKRRRA